MFRFTFTSIPDLVLTVDTVSEAVDLIIAWRTPDKIAEVKIERPTPTAPPVRPRVAANGLQPPPEHLPSGRLFDALTETPQTTLDLALAAKVGTRHAHNCLELLAKRGLVVHGGTARNDDGQIDATWSLHPDPSAPPRTPRTATPPPNADQHRAAPNRGSLTSRVYEALTPQWETSTQLARRLDVSKKSAAQCLTTLFQRAQIERDGPMKCHQGYYYTYRRVVQ